MGVDGRQVRALGGGGDQVVHGLVGERLAPLGDEQPRQGVGARHEVALDRPELVAGHGVLNGQPALQPPHPEA